MPRYQPVTPAAVTPETDRPAAEKVIAGDPVRDWTGTVHLLAVYDRALDIDEYLVNHAAGPAARGGS